MDGYPSTPLNLSDGTTMTQDGGGEDETDGGGEDETDDEKPFAQVGDLEAHGTRSPATNEPAPRRCYRTRAT